MAAGPECNARVDEAFWLRQIQRLEVRKARDGLSVEEEARLRDLIHRHDDPEWLRAQDFKNKMRRIVDVLQNEIRSNEKLKADEREQLKQTQNALQRGIARLGRKITSNKDLDALESVITAAYQIGWFGGHHPIEGKLRAAPASAGRTIKTQKRRKIVLSEASPVIKSHPTWTSNRVAEEICDAVNRQLEESDKVKPNTIRKDVKAIKKKLDVRS
jgi:hypothetical protein